MTFWASSPDVAMMIDHAPRLVLKPRSITSPTSTRFRTAQIVDILDAQQLETVSLLRGIAEQKSLYRYAPDKWSIREVVGHLNDCERLFVFRAFWFARAFDSPLPSFDQNLAVSASGADERSWSSHVDEVRGHPPRDAGILSSPSSCCMDAPRHRERQPVLRASARVFDRRARHPPHECRPRAISSRLIEAAAVVTTGATMRPHTTSCRRWRDFVLEFEERWQQDGKDWYSRELARADVDNGAIACLSVYCTGDWDESRRAEHARAVQLLRP